MAMSSVIPLGLHVIVACSVWQSAQAAPALAIGSAPVNSGQALGIAVHQPFLNTLSDLKSDYKLGSHLESPKSLVQAPQDEIAPLAKDEEFNKGRMFAWSTSKLLKHPNESPAQSLGLDTVYQWEPLVKQYQELTGGKMGSLKDWLEKNNVIQGTISEQEVSDLEWLFLRAGSSRGIWWKGHQLASWRESNYDWKTMITIGDRLQFDRAGQDQMGDKRIKNLQKELIPLLESGKWTYPFLDSFFGEPNGAESSREFLALKALGGNSLYDQRIGQVVNKIVSKIDDYKGDPSELPARLKSDLYLLALLRGKVRKAQSDTELLYVVTMPHHTFTVRKFLDGQELRVSLRPESQGRLLTETPARATAAPSNGQAAELGPPPLSSSAASVKGTSPDLWKSLVSPRNEYQPGQVIVGPSKGRTTTIWPPLDSPSPSDDRASISPAGSPGQLDETLPGSPAEGPSESEAMKWRKGRTRYHFSAASRPVTPWAIPARVLHQLTQMVTNTVRHKGGSLQG